MQQTQNGKPNKTLKTILYAVMAMLLLVLAATGALYYLGGYAKRAEAEKPEPRPTITVRPTITGSLESLQERYEQFHEKDVLLEIINKLNKDQNDLYKLCQYYKELTPFLTSEEARSYHSSYRKAVMDYSSALFQNQRSEYYAFIDSFLADSYFMNLGFNSDATIQSNILINTLYLYSEAVKNTNSTAEDYRIVLDKLEPFIPAACTDNDWMNYCLVFYGIGEMYYKMGNMNMVGIYKNKYVALYIKSFGAQSVFIIQSLSQGYDSYVSG